MLPDILALILTFALALLWLRLMDFAAHRGWISSDLSRKIIHMGTGPIYVLCWLFFRDAPDSTAAQWGPRYLAALVPLAITSQFVLVGTGIVRDEAAVRAMSRTGDRREILRGPLYYGVIFVVMTILYWRNSPIGMVALMLMCGGDGLADILGRRFGKSRLPWNARKTWIGSLGMFLGGWLFAAGILAAYVGAGFFAGAWATYLPAVSLIALVGTLVESLPFSDIDNLTITLAAVFLGHLLF